MYEINGNRDLWNISKSTCDAVKNLEEIGFALRLHNRFKKKI